MDKICGIYRIISPHGKIYIGKSVDIKRRWNLHRCKKGLNGGFKISNSLKKYGCLNHTFEIIEVCLREELSQKEIFWIKFYDTFDSKHGLNLTSGGDGGDYVLSDSSKQKISKANKGKKKPERSVEYRRNIGLAKKGRIVSQETRDKISKASKGKVAWNKGRKTNSPAWNRGIPHSEETKLKIRNARKNTNLH